MRITAYSIGPEEKVGCYFCMQNGKHDSYGQGEAFLCGPDHVPCNGNANYICKSHLEKISAFNPELRVEIIILPISEPEIGK